jgi:NADP-dependent 3-hydroxy acid dehydrogenase YdfG
MSTTPVILLTGASRGLGLAIARHLLEQTSWEPNLVLVARTAAALTSLKNQYPTRVQCVVGDLGTKTTETVAEAVSKAIEAFGKLDSVIINHGVLEPVSSLAQLDIEQAKKAFDVNFFSVMALVTAAIPELRKSQGRVLFVSSGAAVKSYHGWSVYGYEKFFKILYT